MLEFRLETLATAPAACRLAKAAVAILADSLADCEIVHDFDLALTEACANAVRHAYRPGAPGTLQIVLRLFPEEAVEALVIDHGQGPPEDFGSAPPPGPGEEGGRGLIIIERLMDRMRLVRENGTTILSIGKNVGPGHWIAGRSSTC
ncbi:putative anti-sigma regulatory factor, serine/threonine protein kinase [Alkalidesulfovibrio alkalitolerans DSM 16529]|jgi:serine/threonine-protein kinase RsbW|uniref:Putative anti-sigma regulatory factor, serine/threonine protein kinase n=1 Tax=Alkalidesulfovibrio alkalitolerans DSM 16529 TaxID=1121439 RepID=S7UQ94_9BACT|nr:ATP-binding protein [Alkalidesulfovibrio alkalitolerans]EPR36214.1 putative anti-sigma regulatory factor, serine/threonine protein kinase [Alkalidesulfovibrio alkalitolerans DSM 16529]